MFFDATKTTLGQTFEYSKLISKILSIEGVAGFRTKNIATQEVYQGLSFLMWNPVYEDLDVNFVVNDTELNSFDFMYFYDLIDIHSKIEIINSSSL